MLIRNEYYALELDERTCAVRSFRVKDREYIAAQAGSALFWVSLIDGNGKIRKISSDEAREIRTEQRKGEVRMLFSGLADGELDAVAVVKTDEGPLTRWRLCLENRTADQIEYLTFPIITVPNRFRAQGGTGRLFTAAMEGAVVEDPTIRDRTFVRYYPPGYPSKGWEGAYPGACPMQFMAFYDDAAGLYFGAHDSTFQVKAIEWQHREEGVFLEQTLFPGLEQNTAFHYEYDVVLGAMGNDWYDAAEIYRNFLESSGMIGQPRLEQNASVPGWVKENPIVVIYPVRGQKDTGDMSPNCFYPYTEGMKYIDRLSQALDTNILVLLCHWEGTAPWAPPYVWPPYGDGENLKQYVRDLHEKGHLFGVYCSGPAWTQHSNILPEYNREKEFEEKHLERIMCKAPDQSLPYSLLCAGPIRTGYDMCPACEQTREIVVREIEKILDGLDVDYIQFFDQFLGGGAYCCYADSHGHPRSPGHWQVEAVEKMLTQIETLIAQKKKTGKVLIGCESAASEATMRHLMFNDLRYNINYLYGIPVPAYNFMFHEYVNNFMGNQNTSYHTIDYAKYPDNIFYRFAYSFLQGDVLTLVLKDGGKVHWDWCTPWDAPEVDQEEILRFVRELNDWRKGCLYGELHFGRMIRPRPVVCGEHVEEIKYGGEHRFRSVQTAAYRYRGREVQILVNYLGTEQTPLIELGGKEKSVTVIRDAGGSTQVLPAEGRLELKLAPRSVAAILL